MDFTNTNLARIDSSIRDWLRPWIDASSDNLNLIVNSGILKIGSPGLLGRVWGLISWKVSIEVSRGGSSEITIVWSQRDDTDACTNVIEREWVCAVRKDPIEMNYLGWSIEILKCFRPDSASTLFKELDSKK